ncbi:hypothetical protein FRC03_009299 [Tulasnella sp. 419]|nr:hypothetical protein FRC02_007452 [Tulasnella sp. 418]KAG8958266.1 hypothetical protein FRC03_009299 [Tulasnella sp. 419]
MAPKTNIVIIGGGNAGIYAARSLAPTLNPDDFSLKLITERTFHIHYPAMLRVLVTSEGSYEKLALTPYDRLFRPGEPGEVISGTVEEILDEVVKLQDGQEVPYDWLIVASGTKWEGPLKMPLDAVKAHEWIDSWREKFKSAKDIVVVGGGSVGLELAGEIRHYHPDSNVTLIQASEELFNDTYAMKFRRRSLEAMENLGVRVLLHDRVGIPQIPVKEVMTLNGVKVKTDLIIPTRGGRPNTGFLKKYDPTVLTETGHVRVLPTLCVPLANGKKNVFALGDIISWPEQHMLSKIQFHVSVLIPNLLNSIRGKRMKKQYSGFIEAIILPFGPYKGIGWIPLFTGDGVVLGDWAAAKLKGKGLFVSLSRKPLGYPSKLRSNEIQSDYSRYHSASTLDIHALR